MNSIQSINSVANLPSPHHNVKQTSSSSSALTTLARQVMEISRSSTPEAPPQDLWSSILDSVSSSRSIPAKQILILGQPSSGKSAIASALLHKPVSDEQKDDQRTDFAIGYDFADVRDDADEGEHPSVFSFPQATNNQLNE